MTTCFKSVRKFDKRRMLGHFLAQYTVSTCPKSKEFPFWEGDFDTIDHEDLLVVFKELRTWLIRPTKVTNTLEVVKRYIHHTINLACVEDV